MEIWREGRNKDSERKEKCAGEEGMREEVEEEERREDHNTSTGYQILGTKQVQVSVETWRAQTHARWHRRSTCCRGKLNVFKP